MTDQPAPLEQPDQTGVTLEEIRAQMDPTGMILLDAAVGAALRVKLATELQRARARIADLEAQKAPGATGPADV